MWYLDSGCSRHMIGDKRKFKNFKRNEQGFFTYGDNNKGKILERVMLVEEIHWRSKMYYLWKD